MELEEMFVPIPFFENFAVSNYGTVINLSTEKEVKQWLNVVENRMKVRFFVLGAYIDFFVDNLVAEAFFVNYRPGINIYYKNGKVEDCTVLNLSFDKKYAPDLPKSYARIYVDEKGKVREKKPHERDDTRRTP